MITLYLKTGCPFCGRVLATVDAYGIPFVEKNVSDPKVVEELVSLGGKKQEPFMVDGDIMMYESGAIIEYLEKNYAKDGVVKKPKIHFAQNTDVCPS
jgi:glutathione S-transferase